MNKWRKEVLDFFTNDVKVEFLKENENALLYKWIPDKNRIRYEYIGFTLKRMNRSYAFNIRKKGHGGIFVWWRETFSEKSWNDGKPCAFNHLSQDLKYLENAIWVSMI